MYYLHVTHGFWLYDWLADWLTYMYWQTDKLIEVTVDVKGTIFFPKVFLHSKSLVTNLTAFSKKKNVFNVHKRSSTCKMYFFNTSKQSTKRYSQLECVNCRVPHDIIFACSSDFKLSSFCVLLFLFALDSCVHRLKPRLNIYCQILEMFIWHNIWQACFIVYQGLFTKPVTYELILYTHCYQFNNWQKL